MRLLTLLPLIALCLSCNDDRVNYSENMEEKPASELAFDKTKWTTKEGKDYPYRAKMLNAIIYDDSIRTLKQKEILNLLGEPSYYRDDSSFLHYRINETRLGPWILHTETMVIKLTTDSTIEWIRVHK